VDDSIVGANEVAVAVFLMSFLEIKSCYPASLGQR
jgi:hypothetical protein